MMKCRLTNKKLLLIDNFINLQRINANEKAGNPELVYQIKIAKVNMSSLGIDLSDLEIK